MKRSAGLARLLKPLHFLVWASLHALLPVVGGEVQAGEPLMGHQERHRHHGHRASSSSSSRRSYAVEGCFNTFDVFARFPAPASRGFMNNAECQAVGRSLSSQADRGPRRGPTALGPWQSCGKAQTS